MKRYEIRFADACSGIGGFRLGLEQTDPRYKCVWSCESNKEAKAVYNYNYGETNSPQDISDIKARAIPEIDVLIAGFQYQTDNLNGDQRGFTDAYRQVLYRLCCILWNKRPKYYVFENIPELLSYKGGETFRTILTLLWKLGYTVEWQILNLRDFGIPQNRERILIGGHLRGESCTQIFPLNRSERVYIAPENGGTLEGEWFGSTDCLTTLPNNSERGKPYILMNQPLPPDDYIPARMDCKTHELYTSVLPRHSNDELLGAICPYCGKWVEECNCINRTPPFEDGKSIQLRRFTPLEYERLQGFPDNWTAQGHDEDISDTQRYSLLGNSTPIPIAQAVGERLIEIEG
jgi:DNA (cytosine-5)-methyltransferase 1